MGGMNAPVLLFANPIAGRGRGLKIARRVEEHLRASGFEVRSFLERPEEIRREQLHCPVPATAAIAVGGDGTLRAVADMLLRCEVSPVPPLLVVPLGTANLMGRHLGIDWDVRDWRGQLPDRLVQVLQLRRIVRLDAARANDRLFLLMAGVGIDGQIVHELARVRRGPIDLTSYVLPAALALTGYSYPAIRVEIDGSPAFGPAPGMAFIGNVPEYGTGFPILTQARSDDGLLDICILPCRSRAEALRLLLHAAVGEHLLAGGVIYAKAKTVRVSSDEPVPVQVDGDASGHTPLDIRLLPQRLPFIVP